MINVTEHVRRVNKDFTYSHGENGQKIKRAQEICQRYNLITRLAKWDDPREGMLTIRQPCDILRMEFPDSDILLSNGYLAKGDPMTIFGQGGIGKSRLVMQLIICLLLGKRFLGWDTNGQKTRWLLLQTENGNRRLNAELARMFSLLTLKEIEIVNNGLFIHTLENDADSYLAVMESKEQAKIAEVIARIDPTGIVWDVLRDFGIGYNLDSDAEMRDVLARIGHLTRCRNVDRIPVIVSHALTGKQGHSKAIGYERASFGRNSKAMHAWTRAQINLAPYEENSNEALIVASGKANNVKEFEPFGIRMDEKTFWYDVDDSIDIEAWNRRVKSKNVESKARVTIAMITAWVQQKHPTKAELVKLIKETGVNQAYAYEMIKTAEKEGKIILGKDNRYILPR